MFGIAESKHRFSMIQAKQYPHRTRQSPPSTHRSTASRKSLTGFSFYFRPDGIIRCHHLRNIPFWDAHWIGYRVIGISSAQSHVGHCWFNQPKWQLFVEASLFIVCWNTLHEHFLYYWRRQCWLRQTCDGHPHGKTSISISHRFGETSIGRWLIKHFFARQCD